MELVVWRELLTLALIVGSVLVVMLILAATRTER